MNDTLWVNLITAQTETPPLHSNSLDILAILSDASGVVLVVIVLLLLLSIGSWFIIVYKYLYLFTAKSQTIKFLDEFWQSRRLDAISQSARNFDRSPVSHVYIAGYDELNELKNVNAPAPPDRDNKTLRRQLGGIENVERALRRAITTETTQLNSLLSFLATVGSNAVFIGLFGTVWGIMVAFVNINAAGAAGLDVVAAPIAEALIVTAFGLVTAIPAGVAYNYFLTKITVMEAEMENFSNDFLNIVKRYFFK